ncbi:MAG: hypothetical protein K6F61_03845 [Clostridiales bacterium]|nr:hypothetical protein [Clostridiales bacterium]
MFRNIRKPLAILLAIATALMIMPAFAETVTVDELLGTLEGETYTNAFIGLGCDLSGMHIDSKEEIEAVNNLTKSLLSEDISALVQDNITVMSANSADRTQSINIQLRNMKEYVTAYRTIGLKAIAEASLSQYVSMLETQGMTELNFSVADQDIGGQAFTSMDGDCMYLGMHMYTRQVWMLKGDYLVYVTATSLNDNTKDELFTRFFLLQ